MSKGGHSEPLLQLTLFYQSTPLSLKVVGGWWGGVVAHVIIVSAPVQRIGFGAFQTLSGLRFRTWDLFGQGIGT